MTADTLSTVLFSCFQCPVWCCAVATLSAHTMTATHVCSVPACPSTGRPLTMATTAFVRPNASVRGFLVFSQLRVMLISSIRCLPDLFFVKDELISIFASRAPAHQATVLYFRASAPATTPRHPPDDSPCQVSASVDSRFQRPQIWRAAPRP